MGGVCQSQDAGMTLTSAPVSMRKRKLVEGYMRAVLSCTCLIITTSAGRDS